MNKGFLALLILMILPIYRASAAGPIASELERVKGFEAHEKFQKDYDRQREQGASEIEKKRLEWENQLQAAIPEQKAAKAREAKSLTEDSPEYFQDLKNKEAEQKKHEALANEYSVESKRQKRGYVNLLSEAREYGLDESVERIDWKKRALYDAKGKAGGASGRGATSGFTRPSDFSTAPEGQDFSTPPPPPPTQSGFDGGSGPEFFEPDIPPPPPEGGFDSEEIPPPIFDEPEF